MTVLFDIDPIIEKLRADVPALRAVSGAAELAAGVESGKGLQTPCAFVVLVGEQGSDLRGFSGAYLQPTHVALSVMLVVRNYTRSTLGAAAGADLLPALAAVRKSLLGWKPAGASDVLSLTAGRVHEFDAGTLWWEDVYRTRYTLNPRATP